MACLVPVALPALSGSDTLSPLRILSGALGTQSRGWSTPVWLAQPRQPADLLHLATMW